jgi:hypothetical protein
VGQTGQLQRVEKDGQTVPMSCSHRSPGDDFFCLRYQVWYASFDCAIRSRFRTFEGCLNCEQGRFNLKRHFASIARMRVNGPGVASG